MAEVFPAGAGFTAERFFRLVDDGLLAPDDRVELLEGVVVAMAPQNAPHAAEVAKIYKRLSAAVAAALGESAHLRSQLPLLAGRSFDALRCARESARDGALRAGRARGDARR